MDTEGGLVFNLVAGLSSETDLQNVPDADQFAAVLQQFRTSVFKPQEFPPCPPERDVHIRIQLEESAQVPASPVRKLSLVEQLLP
jgi:hypothetical protein